MSAPEVVQVILPPPTTVDLVVTGGLDQVSEWGLITGNLPDQTDLQTALDAKLDISRIVSDIDLIGGTVLTLGQTYHDTFNSNRTLTFSGTPVNGDIETRLRMYLISPMTLTFPSSYRIGQLTNPVTTLDFPPGYHELSWSYAGGIFWLLDDVDSGEGVASWGSITGDITDQTDLVSYVATHGGSFLSNETARVDLSGNDSTGAIGDLGKPFLTVQAAVTAFENKLTANPTDDPASYVVDVGNNYFSAAVSTSLPSITFVGTDYEVSNAFGTLTLTDNGPFRDFKMCRCNGSSVVATVPVRLTVLLQNGGIGDITTSGALKIGCDVMGFGEVTGNITAGGGVIIMGLRYAGGIISAPGFEIHISDSAPRYSNLADGSYGAGLVSIDSAGSEVWTTNSMLGDVTCATLHLIDTRVQGTNSAISTVYADVLLLPRYQKSIDFDATAGLKLVNDSASPGNSKYYGTDSGGTKGYFSLSAGSGTVTQFNFTNSTGITGTVTTATTTPTLSLALTNAAVGLGSVTNDAQTKAAIVPNTAPAAGQFLAGNAGGTAYAPVTLSGSGATATLSSAGVLTISAIPNATLSNSSITIAGTSTSLGGSITLDAISGVSSNGFLKRTGANTWTNDSSTYLTGNQTISLSGDVTGSGATAITATLANIPDVTPAVGSILHTNIAAPTSPASGTVKVFTDSTDLRFHDKNSAGTIGTTVVADTGSSNNFLTAISAAGVISKAQPTDANLSLSDITTNNASTSNHGFLKKLNNTVTNYMDGTGNWSTPAGSGSGTVTSIATTSPISGGTITSTGTLSLLVNVDHAFTAAQSITTAPASNTAGTGLLLTDTTPAPSSGNQQYSPAIRWTGQGWKTTATAGSQAVDFRSYVVPVQGSANPTGYLTLESSINGAAFGKAFNFYSTGNLQIPSGLFIYPSSDSTSAIVFSDATGTGGGHSCLTIDTQNARVGINSGGTAPMDSFDVGGGKFRVSGTGGVTVVKNIACSTTSLGVPAILKNGRVTAQTAANSNISQFTVGAADGSFEVSMNMNVTAATVLSTSLNCDYTDESNTARTMIFPTTSLSGTFLSGGLITATGAFETPAMHIRCKASTNITLYTAAGTYTSVTYTAEGIIKETV